jgi:exopolyphosphatase / guanosine-5'-triphosphate,3'-diphosphate pyrophosphatase
VRLGVLDVGSNTVHLLLVDAHQGSAPVPASKLKMPLRMAEHLSADGTVDESAIHQLIDFIREGQQLSEDMGATELMAFATSAIRDAPNGDDVLERIRVSTGLHVDVLSGDDEARMTFLAVRRWFGWSTGRLLVVDIGGGSLELAAGTDEAPDVAVSLPLGAGRMTRQFLAGDPPSAAEVRELRKFVRASIADVVGRMKRVGEPRIAAATSKTLRQLARIAGAAPSSEGMYVRRTLTREDLALWTPKLASMTAKERQTLPGVSEGRSRQLLAGAIVAEASMELLDLDELVICPWAMREGIILQRIDGLTT